MTFSDLALARRLEGAEGRANADFVDGRALAFPDRHAAWIEVGGAHAMFDGVTSPITQTFGLGLDRVSPSDLDQIEQFFILRQAPVFHEVCPLADAALFPLLHARGYVIVEFTSVMWREIGDDRTAAGGGAGVTARRVREDEHDVWAATAARGWGEQPELTEFMHELASVNRQRKAFVAFIAERAGEAIAAGGLSLADGVALLAGASTVPEARRQGAQGALLDARLRYAAGHGCDLAMMCALPGSDSQRNAERQGFRIAYTRLKWRLGETRC